VRVNLILSILVFQERKYCLHDNVKLVFLKKYIYTKTIHTIKKKKHPNSASKLHCSKYTKTIHTLKKKIPRTVQVNCTVHGNSAIYLHCSSELALFE